MEQSNALIQKINFDGDTMAVVERNGEQFVAMKPICEAMGLDWGAQRQLMGRDPVLSSTTCIIHAVAEDGKHREVVCLPMSYLNGWLFKIDVTRYESERREKIIRYQKECYQVLFNHFFGKRPTTRTISQDQESMRKERLFLVEKRKFEKLVEAEARRVFNGKSKIEDLDPVPTLQQAVKEALENDTFDLSRDPFIDLLESIRQNFLKNNGSLIRSTGIKVVLTDGVLIITASSRNLQTFSEKFSKSTKQPFPFDTCRHLTGHFKKIKDQMFSFNWIPGDQMKMSRGYRRYEFKHIEYVQPGSGTAIQ